MKSKGLCWILGFSLVKIALVCCQGNQNQTSDDNNPGDADYYQMVHIYHKDMMDNAQDYPSAGQQAAAPFGYRPGSATRSNTCQQVRAVPSQLRSSSVMKPRGLGAFYQKYTEAYGIPVLSSRRVPDEALRRACYTLRFLLAGNSKVRKAFYRLSGRVAVIGKNEGTNWIPEHSNLPNWWNQRARGLGATTHAPVSSGGEENVMCYQTDRYRAQDIFLHESAHGVHLLGAANGIPGWDRRLRALYSQAKRKGLWARTYSMSTAEEYFAEGTQSYFNVNSYSAVPDGVRGPISTRPKLKNYDPQLYKMIEEVFPCDNVYLKRCESNRAKEHSQVLKMDCDIHGRGGRNTTPAPKTQRPRTTKRITTPLPITTTTTINNTATTTTGGDCQDKHHHCGYWAGVGECSRNPPYMNVNCKKSCDLCECVDKHRYCARWADSGQCDINPSYMNANCAKSCEKC